LPWTATIFAGFRFRCAKANLARLLARRPEGIFLSPFEQGEIGPDLFRKACEFLSNLLARQHTLIWETSGPNEPPFRPTNLRHLLIKSDELRTLLEGHLRSMGVVMEADQSPAPWVE
jgi:hypothetical protein